MSESIKVCLECINDEYPCAVCIRETAALFAKPPSSEGSDDGRLRVEQWVPNQAIVDIEVDDENGFEEVIVKKEKEEVAGGKAEEKEKKTKGEKNL